MTCFLSVRYWLRESLVLANSNDLNKLTACALVLLGHIYLSLGNKTVSLYNQCVNFSVEHTCSHLILPECISLSSVGDYEYGKYELTVG